MMNSYSVEMVPVHSSNIRAIGYNGDDQILYVEFLSGSLYSYESVPITVFIRFKSVPSKGAYFNQNIKNYYECKQIR